MVRSWTRVSKQIHEIEENRFFYEMFYRKIYETENFMKRQNLAFGWAAGYSPSNPSISGVFLEFPNFLRS